MKEDTTFSICALIRVDLYTTPDWLEGYFNPQSYFMKCIFDSLVNHLNKHSV